MKASLAERCLYFPAGGRFKINARAKSTTRTSKKNDPHTVVLSDDIQTIVEFAHHGISNAVEVIRSIHGDRGSCPLHFI